MYIYIYTYIYIRIYVYVCIYIYIHQTLNLKYGRRFALSEKDLSAFGGGSWARRSPEMQKLHNCQGEEILIVKLFDNGET